jgi:sn-glycerol 3-phosphate transport system ATP-binding protein
MRYGTRTNIGDCVIGRDSTGTPSLKNSCFIIAAFGFTSANIGVPYFLLKFNHFFIYFSSYPDKFTSTANLGSYHEKQGDTMASIVFQKVSKTFGKNMVIKDMDLVIEDGKFTILVGPSGCGKTTLLRMIAGIGKQSSGSVLIGDKDVSDIEPGDRGVAMVFQNYAIYPTMTVRKNIEFGLKNNKVPKEERQLLIKDVSEKVGLTQYLDRKPGTLSGGQRQRVALARAMVKKPAVFLMDEPLSNLDAKLRVQMRVELIELHKKLNTTFVYVTHDQVEAMSMADTIVLMDQGVIQQVASPERIFNDPDNLFTAEFIGSPAMNILPLGYEGEIKMGFRPERADISKKNRTGCISLKGIIIAREMLGNETIYTIKDVKGLLFTVRQLVDKFRMGDEVFLHIEEKHLYFFDKNDKRIQQDEPQFNTCIASARNIS